MVACSLALPFPPDTTSFSSTLSHAPTNRRALLFPPTPPPTHSPLFLCVIWRPTPHHTFPQTRVSGPGGKENQLVVQPTISATPTHQCGTRRPPLQGTLSSLFVSHSQRQKRKQSHSLRDWQPRQLTVRPQKKKAPSPPCPESPSPLSDKVLYRNRRQGLRSMASNYPAQTYTIPTTNKAGHTYGPNRNPSPASSTSPATSPHNISPTSPRFHNYMHPPPNPHKQLREQRKPLYVPAVLRPTEFPKASGSVTPPKSVHGSLDSLDSRAELDQAIDGRDQWPFEGIGGDGIDEEELGEVTGPPGREHWKVCAQTPPPGWG